ncbi:hypothetical protein [Actinoplanes derwentensis]|uniref:Uncharacterized protein n=1 Tax=Actinoplanes derwentensis TaxID=113562 RepID=A0A1H2D106_9ACTN|nr:hypothetical protein [Actinoplanes derwentensis]GID85796.1 hypothetical protein Ade03nite_47200 [Actinoplanes derwentensis]SDT76435.1 hypothetical protein SAMN04489716_7620 [Actinoplanes derwentensis]
MNDGGDIVRRLYESPPDGFVAARTAAVAEARRAGDVAAARHLAALKKPTVAAWIVNLVALQRPELLDELAGIADALRAAQRDLQGDQMRELSLHRRRFVTSLVEAARRLAVEAGTPGAKLPLAEVEATFTAALAEPEIAGQIRSGRLIRAVSYAGFGEVPRPRLRLLTGLSPAPALPPAPSLVRDETAQRRRELEREMTAAEDAEKRADLRVTRAEQAERDAEHLVEDLEAELAELDRRRAEAVADVARRRLGRRTAEREAATARRAVGEAQAALDDLSGHQ